SLSPANAHALPGAEIAAYRSCNGFVLLPPSVEVASRRDRLPPAHRRAQLTRSMERNRELARRSIPSVYLYSAAVTASGARRFGVNIESWRRQGFVGSAVEPRFLRRAGRSIVSRLRHGRRITIQHPNGTHLELGLAGRQPFLDDGMVDAQDLVGGRTWTLLPSGFVRVTLDERRGEGRFISNLPSRNFRGIFAGADWTFHDGRLARHSLEQGRTSFERRFRGAGAERVRPALLAVGLNPELHDYPLGEDQEQGLVTLYIGHNDDYGGRTRGSFRDYALLRGAQLLVDDKPLRLQPRSERN
ncbi:MAG: hypothetical protein WCA77_08415, partial [Thermoplasmata archaeon]